MPGLSFYDKQHIQKVAAQQAVIANIFNQFILSVSPYLRKWDDAGKNNVWIQNHSIENAVDKELLTLESLLLKNIESFQFDAWKRSEMKNDDFIREYIKGMSISSVAKEGMFTHSMSAFSAFQKEVDAQGVRLSDRVWTITQQTKSQLEFYLNSGVAAGRSSNEISRDMRQLLDKPDKRFRRVRNDEGKLVLSRPMKDYHPGQGVYRSAKMNALRTSATTTNTAYRSADHERWSQQDFVLGIEIQRSANNKGPCKICDAMIGKYPKTFKFTGWHPFCICFATPITMEPEDLADYLLTDEVPEQLVIKDIPSAAQSFVDNNKQALDKAYWMKDNFTGEPLKIASSSTAEQKPAKIIKSKRIKTDEEKADIQQKWNERKLYNKIANTESEIRLNKKFETGVVFDRNGNIIIDKRGESFSVSFTNEECWMMKDGIFTHNHPRGWGYPEKSLGRIGNSFSPEDVFLAVRWDVAEMRAVTPNYTFIMKRPEKGWGIDLEQLNRIIKLENYNLNKEFSELISKDIITPSQANVLHYHTLWKRISTKLEWSYSKAKTR